MARLARAGKTNMLVRTTTLAVIQDLPSKAYIAEVEAVWRFVKEQIRYVKDVHGVETVQTPEKTLELRAGDCDDSVTLICAMLESIGHPCRMVAMAFQPNNFSHVLAETKVGRGARATWIALETTENKPFGWYPRNRPHQRMVVTV